MPLYVQFLKKGGDKLFILFLPHFLLFFLKEEEKEMGEVVKILYYLFEERLYRGLPILGVKVNFQILQLK
jgi:hypothetical protein